MLYNSDDNVEMQVIAAVTFCFASTKEKLYIYWLGATLALGENER